MKHTSPGYIWVAISTPDLAGINSGDGGLSRRGSVSHSASAVSTTSQSSSKYKSVCIDKCCRPGTGNEALRFKFSLFTYKKKHFNIDIKK